MSLETSKAFEGFSPVARSLLLQYERIKGLHNQRDLSCFKLAFDLFMDARCPPILKAKAAIIMSTDRRQPRKNVYLAELAVRILDEDLRASLGIRPFPDEHLVEAQKNVSRCQRLLEKYLEERGISDDDEQVDEDGDNLDAELSEASSDAALEEPENGGENLIRETDIDDTATGQVGSSADATQGESERSNKDVPQEMEAEATSLDQVKLVRAPSPTAELRAELQKLDIRNVDAVVKEILDDNQKVSMTITQAVPAEQGERKEEAHSSASSVVSEPETQSLRGANDSFKHIPKHWRSTKSSH